MNQAAKYCEVSSMTIRRLVAAGLLEMNQVVPRAPWEIRRSDLDAEPVRRVVETLHRTGRLVLERGAAAEQKSLFIENKGVDNGRHNV